LLKLGQKFLSDQTHFYLMHMDPSGKDKEKLWEYAKTHSVIGLGLPIVKGDWADFMTGLGIFGRELFIEHNKVWSRQFDIFCKVMREGEIVVVMDGWSILLGVGRLVVKDSSHPYRYESSLKDTFFDHVRDVEWEYKDPPVKLVTPLPGFENTLLDVKPPGFYWLRTYDIDLP
jgi:hypothetical protein